MTELKFIETIERILGRIGGESGPRFERYNFGKFQNVGYHQDEWTYQYDGTFQVEICRWQDALKRECRTVPAPDHLLEMERDVEFEEALQKAINALLSSQPDEEKGSDQ